MDEEYNLRGGRLTPQELFDHVSTLAAMTLDNVERATALQDQAQRSLAAMGSAHVQALQRLQQVSDELQARYAPAAVAVAIERAQSAAVRFDQEVESAIGAFRAGLKRQQGPFWTRTAGAALVALTLVVLVVSLIVRWVPSLEQVQVRQHQVAELDADLNLLDGVIVDHGRKWVPILAPRRICLPAGGDNCALYGEILQ